VISFQIAFTICSGSGTRLTCRLSQTLDSPLTLSYKHPKSLHNITQGPNHCASHVIIHSEQIFAHVREPTFSSRQLTSQKRKKNSHATPHLPKKMRGTFSPNTATLSQSSAPPAVPTFGTHVLTRRHADTYPRLRLPSQRARPPGLFAICT
jgi:hypothetical protein